MAEYGRLYVSWKDYPPSTAVNVWRVKDDIEYHDGKLVFQIENGSVVRINPDQIVRIGVTKKIDIEAIHRKYGIKTDGND